MRALLAALPIALAGCVTTTPGELSIADRIIAGVVEACKIIPAVQAVTEIVDQFVVLGDTTDQLIALADTTADAICAAFRTDPLTPTVAGVALTGTVVQ